eukprot:15434252-Alexandrium_andersonii.AAC.2
MCTEQRACTQVAHGHKQRREIETLRGRLEAEGHGLNRRQTGTRRNDQQAQGQRIMNPPNDEGVG